MLINRNSRTNHTALSVEEFHSAVIASDSDIIKQISMESPRSELQWSLNGIFVQEEPGRVKFNDYDIGTYSLMYENLSKIYSMR